MERKNLGSQGIKASAMGLGCMGMSEFYGERNDREIEVIQKAYDLGINFFDTADMYGPFINEELVGKAIKDIRKDVTLATKFGIVRDPNDPTKRGINGTPAYVRSSCEGSLKRLGVEHIDLYYLHRKDPDTDIEVTVGAMAELVREGKIRSIGLSEVTVETLRAAHKVHPITAVQSEYSLWSREPEDGMLDACKELGIAFVAYSPLGRGFLTGDIKSFDDLAADDYRRHSPRFQGENFQKNLALVKRIEEMAAKKNCTTSQLALAWVMGQGEHIFPIPGTKKLKYIAENAAAADIKLSQQELDEINSIVPKGSAAGTRYPEAAMKSVNK